MEVGGLLAAPFSEGTSLLVSQVGFRVSAIGNAGNITMDLLEGKIDMAAYRTIKFVATLGMGKAIEKLPYGSKLLDGIKTFTDTYVMPIFEDQFKKTN